MASTNISEITEIVNITNDTYYMYVWDNAHEGRYKSYTDNSGDWNYPSEGTWLTIGPNAHLRADDCGIPDGGKTAGMDRVRVLFKAKTNEKPALKGDPGHGLRINRVGLGGSDELLFRDNATADIVFRVPLPTNMHQSLVMKIAGKSQGGLQFTQSDIAQSGQDQAEQGLKQFLEVFKTLLEIAKNLSEIAAG